MNIYPLDKNSMAEPRVEPGPPDQKSATLPLTQEAEKIWNLTS